MIQTINIRFWESICGALELDTLVLKVWVSASEENKTFEEQVLHSDAIVVGGGNTLNMMGIWKAQGIDCILRGALDKGIILSGGSAGAICWFLNGISDSRPRKLSSVEGLGILPYSSCPHYSQKNRHSLFHQLIKEGNVRPGYAFDEKAGILFVDGKVADCVTQSDRHHAYYVHLKGQQLKVDSLKARLLLQENALAEDEYVVIAVGLPVSEIDLGGKDTPASAYASIIRGKDEKGGKVSAVKIEKLFLFNNELAGVVNDSYLSSMGIYGLWYFYNIKGTWESAGEDIGGETLFECEVTFREKARTVLESARNKKQ